MMVYAKQIEAKLKKQHEKERKQRAKEKEMEEEDPDWMECGNGKKLRLISSIYIENSL